MQVAESRPSPTVTAVVLSFNSRRYIAGCVEALAAAFAGPVSGEIRVIENASTDGSVEILRNLQRRLPGLLFVDYLPENTGTTVSRNIALRAARGRYILIIDSDATISAQTVDYLIDALRKDAGIGLIAPRLNYPDGRFQLSFDQFPTVGRKLSRFVNLKNLERMSAPPRERCDVDYLISAVWLLPRATIDAVGLLDENIFYSPEDVDYCLRIWQAGLRVVYDPAVAAIHDAQEISRGLKISKHTLRHARGLLYYFWKHRYCWSIERLRRRLRGSGARDPINR